MSGCRPAMADATPGSLALHFASPTLLFQLCILDLFMCFLSHAIVCLSLHVCFVYLFESIVELPLAA